MLLGQVEDSEGYEAGVVVAAVLAEGDDDRDVRQGLLLRKGNINGQNFITITSTYVPLMSRILLTYVNTYLYNCTIYNINSTFC